MTTTLKVQNLTGRSGRDVPNQFVIESGTDTVFQSYKTIIVKIDINGVVTLDAKYWNYSRTTSKYRNQFLGEDTATIKHKIEDGTYKLAKLNPEGHQA